MSNHIVTKNFNVFSAAQFKESITEPANTIFYLTYGRHLAWDDDGNPPTGNNSLSASYFDVYDTMIAGKKVNDADVSHMVKRNDWTANTVYSMYDDQTANMDESAFYVTVNEATNYTVFKCLDNNYGAPSTQSPSINEVNESDEIYITTTDGYQWKYMYTIPAVTWDKFSTATYAPVVANTTVETNAVEGSIQTILVTDAGQDYSAYADGYVIEFGVSGNSQLISIAGITSAVYELDANSAPFVKEEVTTSFLESILITDGGTGYLANDTIFIDGGTPTEAALGSITSVDGNGAITGILVDSRGKSYTSTPTVVANTGTGSAATFVGYLGVANGVIVDSNSTHITVSSISGTINDMDEITGAQSGAISNIASTAYIGDDLSSNTDFYKGSSFYVKYGTGAGQIGVIDEYVVTANQKRVLLAGALSVNLASDSFFEIGPQVIIYGDGTGAEARAVINSTLSANVVSNVHVVSTGSGYTWADITIRGNTGFVTNATTNSYLTDSASARAIISPKGGHGSDPLNELFGHRIGVSITFANTETGSLVANNDFRQVSLLKDPVFSNGHVTLTSSDTLFISTEIITGSTSNAVATVISATSGEIFMQDVTGFFSTGETVTGSISGNAVIDVVTQPTNVFRQTYKYTANIVYLGTGGIGFNEDELVTQTEALANAYMLSPLTDTVPDGEVEVTNQRNTFLLSDGSGDKYITGADSSATAKLTGVTLPDVKDGSGEVIYVENMIPISRDNNQSETFRLILEF